MTSETIKECFKKWGFRENPFTETYLADFWARPDKDLNFLKFLLSNSRDQNELLNILIRGEYGSGKTYMLKFLKGYIENKLDGLGIYFQIPRKYRLQGFRDILAEFVRAIGIENLEKLGKEIAEKEGIHEFDVLKDFLIDYPLDGDVAIAIANLVYDNDYALTSAWLFGNSTIHQDRAIGMISSTKDESTIIKLIANLIYLLNWKYNIVGIFIDEFENLSGESQASKSIKEGFRNLYDELLENEKRGSIAIITAITARLEFEITSSIGTAFLDRITYNFSLAPLEEENSKKYIQHLFSYYRENADTSLIPPFADTAAIDLFIKTFPTTKAVSLTSRGAVRTPRRIMKSGTILLTRACSEQVKEINSEFILRTLGQET